MRESELLSENHRSHALEWRSEDTCLHCLMEVICSNPGTKMSIHRRFALATFIQKLSPDVTHAPKPHQDLSSKNLARLLQKNHNVSSQVLTVLLGMYKAQKRYCVHCHHDLIPHIIPHYF